MKLSTLIFAIAVKTASAEGVFPAALRGSQHGYDTACTGGCVCYDPNCDMSKCTSGCTAHGVNTDMSNCQSNCLDYAGGANMECCTSTCTSWMTGSSMPNCQNNCVCYATCTNTGGSGTATCGTGSGGSGQEIPGWSGSTGSDCISSDVLTAAAEEGKALEPVCRYFLEDFGHVQPYVCSEGSYACCKNGLGQTIVTDTWGTCTAIPSGSGSAWTGSPGSDCISSDILTVAAEDGKALEPVCRYFLEDSGHVQPYECTEGPGYACCKTGLGETVITDRLGTCTQTAGDEVFEIISES